MRYTDDHDRVVWRLMLDWFNVALLSVPLASAGVLAIRSLLDLRLGLGYAPSLPSQVLGALATSAILGGIGGATLMGARSLRPALLAEKVRHRAAVEHESPLTAAEMELREAQFGLHRVLDLPAAAFLVYGFVYNADAALLLSIAYCSLAFVLLRPDEERLLRDTMLSLER